MEIFPLKEEFSIELKSACKLILPFTNTPWYSKLLNVKLTFPFKYPLIVVTKFFKAANVHVVLIP